MLPWVSLQLTCFWLLQGALEVCLKLFSISDAFIHKTLPGKWMTGQPGNSLQFWKQHWDVSLFLSVRLSLFNVCGAESKRICLEWGAFFFPPKIRALAFSLLQWKCPVPTKCYLGFRSSSLVFDYYKVLWKHLYGSILSYSEEEVVKRSSS